MSVNFPDEETALAMWKDKRLSTERLLRLMRAKLQDDGMHEEVSFAQPGCLQLVYDYAQGQMYDYTSFKFCRKRIIYEHRWGIEDDESSTAEISIEDAIRKIFSGKWYIGFW
jgi:hypothetical protein